MVIRNRKTLPIWLVAFLIVALSYFVTSWVAGTNQLLGGSVMMNDLSQQYLSLFQYYRHTLFGQFDQAGFSLSNGMGGLMAGNWVYYLISPFNIVSLAFPVDRMPEALYVIIWLKIASAGATFTWFIHKCQPQLANTLAILLGVSYALMGWTMNYQSNLMWLDGIVWLPVIVWQLRQLLAGKHRVPYTLVLALIIISNYYIGFMIAIFLVFLALVYAADQFTSWRQLFIQAGRFIGASLLGGLLSAVALIPLVMDLMANKGHVTTPTIGLATKLRRMLWQVPAQLTPGHIGINAPSLFVGTLVVMAVAGFCVNGRFSWRHRLLNVGVLAVLILSLVLPALYLLWHGNQLPQSYPYRFVFLIGFWLLVMAGEQLAQPDWSRAVWLSSVLFPLGLLGYQVLLRHRLTLSWVAIAWGVGILAILAAGFWIGRKHPTGMSAILVLGVALEIGPNSVLGLQARQTSPGASYAAYVQTVMPEMQALARQQNLGRTEKTFMRGGDRGDGYTFNYRGISAFSSNNDPDLASFLGQMGVPAYGYYEAYFNGTQLTDSLFGIQTLVDYTNPGNAKADLNHYGSRTDVAAWPVVAENGALTAYHNPNALPLGFATAADLTLPKFSKTDVLSNQAAVLNRIANRKRAYFRAPVQPQVNFQNLKQAGPVLSKLDPKKSGTLTLRYPVQAGVPTYLLLDGALIKNAQLTIDGKPITMYQATIQPTAFGVTPAQSQLTITLKLDVASVYYSTLQVRQLNVAALQATTKAIKQGGWRLQTVKHNVLAGRIRLKADQQLQTTIPYTAGWTATVDGRIMPVTRGLKHFLAVKAPAGDHRIELRFRTPGLRLGAVVSFIALLVIAGLWWLNEKRRPTKH